MTKSKHPVPREVLLGSDAPSPAPSGAQDAVARAFRDVGARSEQHGFDQVSLNEWGAAASKLNPLRILVVEDDGMIATLIAETLEAMGHEVCAIATTQADAVAAAERHRPDLLLVDFHLAVGGGAAAVAEILLGGPIVHIFMTGDAMTAAGFDPSVTTLRKPFQDHDLARAIETAFAAKPRP